MLEACVFGTMTARLETVPIPNWAFTDLDFRREDLEGPMLAPLYSAGMPPAVFLTST
jgi:hypothetical protein